MTVRQAKTLHAAKTPWEMNEANIDRRLLGLVTQASTACSFKSLPCKHMNIARMTPYCRL
jgi:hypothetical protein